MKLLASVASAAIVAAAFMPGWALAEDSVEFSVTVTGHVGPNCYWVSGGGDVNLTLRAFADRNARIREQPRRARLGKMGCNQPAYVSLRTENGGMKVRDDADDCKPGGSPYCVNYMATAEWNDAVVTYTTDGSVNTGASSDISKKNRNRQVRLTITPQKPAGDSPVVAGDFTDTLTVQVGPPM